MAYYRRGNRNRKYYKKSYNKKYYKKKNDSIYEIIEVLFFLFSLPFKAIFGLLELIIKHTSKNKNIDRADTSGHTFRSTSNYTNCEKLRSFEIKDHEGTEEKKYEAKEAFITECEKKFFDAIKAIVGENYIVQPQINLASIVNKVTADRYRNELFRNIDFGVFDKSYKLLVLIEINDPSHDRSDRKDRDDKVKKICEEASIPLVTFWTKYGVNEEYIKNRLSKHLAL